MKADSLLTEASVLYAMAQRSEDEARQSAYGAVLRNLDRKVDEFATGAAISHMQHSGTPPTQIEDAPVAEDGGVLATEATEQSVIEANVPSAPVSAPVTDLAAAVQRCFATQAVGDIGDAFVQFRVVLDRQGRLVGSPVLTAPGGRTGAAERQLLRLGSAALEACQPYAGASEFSSLEVAFQASGVSLVETTARTAEAPDDLRLKEEPDLAVAPAPDSREPAPPERSGATAANGQPPAAPAGPGVSEPLASLPASPPLPVPPTVAAPQSAEGALGLGRTKRREIQRRLVLLGFDTRGVDSIFGPGTRSAISNWQRIRGHSATGFLDRDQLLELQAQTEVAFQQWSREQASAKSRRATTAGENARQDSRTGRYLDGHGCLREADGRYVPHFKPACR